MTVIHPSRRRYDVPNRNLAQPSQFAASTGQALIDSGWLDTHVEADGSGYKATLRSVPFEPGWPALDAGCGCGRYLPLLAELIEPTDEVIALDRAPDYWANARRVQEEIHPLPGPDQVTGWLADPVRRGNRRE
jgi:hypothetical protein